LIPGTFAGCAPRVDTKPVWVNDVHSGLNKTLVAKIERPPAADRLREVIVAAREARLPVSIGGGRHAMGGQQFGRATIHVDMTGLDRVIDFDRESGEVEVESGIQWPQLVDWLEKEQGTGSRPWEIVQRQTGADRVCVGGALAANAHGRGFAKKPIVEDVLAFTLMNPSGELLRCSRTENSDLFRLAVGGYGLFGPMTTVRLKLGPRRRVERVTDTVETKDLARHFDERIADGFVSGDLQLTTDLDSEAALREGISVCDRPVADDAPNGSSSSSSRLTRDPDESDEPPNSSEMITEICVPRGELPVFLEDVRADFLEHDVTPVRGMVRLIERDDETYLPWAKDRFACVTFGLRVDHDRRGLKKAPDDFRRLIDRGLERGGGYYLAYHRWAARRQVLAGYPELPEFLRLKQEHDPEERFQSEWYRHYRTMFADIL
jgi:FAD/FMN-containing dehydrogenase